MGLVCSWREVPSCRGHCGNAEGMPWNGDAWERVSLGTGVLDSRTATGVAARGVGMTERRSSAVNWEVVFFSSSCSSSCVAGPTFYRVFAHDPKEHTWRSPGIPHSDTQAPNVARWCCLGLKRVSPPPLLCALILVVRCPGCAAG
jgi:hypothetical protein